MDSTSKTYLKVIKDNGEIWLMPEEVYIKAGLRFVGKEYATNVKFLEAILRGEHDYLLTHKAE